MMNQINRRLVGPSPLRVMVVPPSLGSGWLLWWSTGSTFAKFFEFTISLRRCITFRIGSRSSSRRPLCNPFEAGSEKKGQYIRKEKKGVGSSGWFNRVSTRLSNSRGTQRFRASGISFRACGAVTLWIYLPISWGVILGCCLTRIPDVYTG